MATSTEMGRRQHSPVPRETANQEWEKQMNLFCRPFTTAKIRYFDKNQGGRRAGVARR